MEIDIKSTQYLLHQVSLIDKKYKEIAKITGENFNIFKILRLETNEVRVHSNILAELLNPLGSHEQGNIFLKLFLEQTKLKDFDFDCENANVEVEKHIGYISEDRTSGGNIDIFMTDKDKNTVIIENKIYAGDQENQLLRYFNFGKEYCGKPDKFKLIYLTLDGKDASGLSKSNLTEGKDYIRISYKIEIKIWLEECRKHAASHPMLRETISQYINLIKVLTNQTINNNMSNEIKDLIYKNPEFFDIIPKLPEIRDEIWNEIIKDVISKLNAEYKDPILKKHSIDFYAEFLNDEDGFTFCFFAKKDNVVIHADNNKQIIDKYRDVLKKDNDFVLWGSPICWKIIKNFRTSNPEHGFRLEYMEKFSDLLNSQKREEFLNLIIMESKSYKDDFLKLINSID